MTASPPPLREVDRDCDCWRLPHGGRCDCWDYREKGVPDLVVEMGGTIERQRNEIVALQERVAALEAALGQCVDGLLFAADSMEGEGCWCGGWNEPEHHEYCDHQRARVRDARALLASERAP